MPVGDIVRDRGVLEISIEISVGHVEFAICIVVYVPSGLERLLIFSRDFVPAGLVSITELASPLVPAMRVSQSDELSSVLQRIGA